MGRADWLTPSVLVLQLQNRLQTTTDVVAVNIATGRRRLLFRESSESWINLHDMFTVLPASYACA
jgi:Dipeptidyl peptidase IV (DPP IV) N-terminal region